MDVSIIIVTYNTCRMTSECIESIFSKTKDIDFEIILVDNASKDGSKEFFENDKRIKYIYCDSNLGFGPANNKGIKKAEGKYLFLLNSDTLLLNNAVNEFYNYAEQNDKNRVYGCFLKDINMEYDNWDAPFPTLFSTLKLFIYPYFNMTFNESRPLKLSNLLKVNWISGAAMFIPKNVIQAIGAFNESFFMYYEETEWEKRMDIAGIGRYLIDAPKIQHLSGKSFSNKMQILKLVYSTNSLFLYLKLFNSKIEYYLFRIVCFILRIIPSLFSPSFNNFKERIMYIKCLLR